METILKPGSDKIMAFFYSNKHVMIHLRDLARRTHLNENSATRFLHQLEKMNLLRSHKDGNLKKYSIQKNDRTFALFAYYDILRLNKLPSIRHNSLNYFLKELKEKPIIVILFGSTAKGTFTEDSDIDLLLVVNKKLKTEYARRFAESQTAIRISCLQITYADFLLELKLKQDNVIQSAINTGYPIYNHITFYEVYYEAV